MIVIGLKKLLKKYGKFGINMKVALLTLFEPKVGGGTSYTIRMKKALEVIGLEVNSYVICNKTGKKPKNAIDFEVKYLPENDSVGNALHLNGNYDIIHFTSPGRYSDKPNIRPDYFDTIDKINKPMIVTIHGTLTYRNYPKWREFVDLCSGVVFVRKKIMEYFMLKCPQIGNKALSLIKQPIDVDNVVTEFEEKERVLVNPTRFSSCKRVLKFMEVVPKIQEKDFKVVFAGDNKHGFAARECMTFADNLKDVNFLGGYTPDNVCNIYSKASVMVDCSFYKHDGNGAQYTVQEAMQYGVIPIINTQWYGDLTEKNAFFYEDEKEIPDIIEKIKTMEIGDKFRMLKRNIDYLRENHSFPVIGKKYRNFYEEVFENARRKFK